MPHCIDDNDGNNNNHGESHRLNMSYNKSIRETTSENGKKHENDEMHFFPSCRTETAQKTMMMTMTAGTATQLQQEHSPNLHEERENQEQEEIEGSSQVFFPIVSASSSFSTTSPIITNHGGCSTTASSSSSNNNMNTNNNSNNDNNDDRPATSSHPSLLSSSETTSSSSSRISPSIASKRKEVGKQKNTTLYGSSRMLSMPPGMKICLPDDLSMMGPTSSTSDSNNTSGTCSSSSVSSNPKKRKPQQYEVQYACYSMSRQDAARIIESSMMTTGVSSLQLLLPPPSSVVPSMPPQNFLPPFNDWQHAGINRQWQKQTPLLAPTLTPTPTDFSPPPPQYKRRCSSQKLGSPNIAALPKATPKLQQVSTRRTPSPSPSPSH